VLNADVVGVPAGGGQDEAGAGDAEGSGDSSELFLLATIVSTDGHAVKSEDEGKHGYDSEQDCSDTEHTSGLKSHWKTEEDSVVIIAIPVTSGVRGTLDPQSIDSGNRVPCRVRGIVLTPCGHGNAHDGQNNTDEDDDQSSILSSGHFRSWCSSKW